MFTRIFLLLGLMLAITSCTAIDPAARDLHSPCASDDSNIDSPCIRRAPIENQRV